MIQADEGWDDFDDEVVYTPEFTMSKLHRSSARYKWIDSALGQGKTTGIANEIFKQCYSARAHKRMRRMKWLVVRETYGELESIVCPDMLDWIPEDLLQIQYKKPIMAHFAMDMPDGTFARSEFLMVGMDRKNSLSRIAGWNGTAAWLNELSTLKEETYLKAAERVMRYPGKGRGGFDWGGIIGDYNRPTKRHWIYKRLVVEKAHDPHHEFFSLIPPVMWDPSGQNVIPNPRGEGVDFQELGYEYWLNLARLNAHRRWWIDSYLMNKWVDVYDGDPVHEGFSLEDHVSPVGLPTYRDRRHVISFDWGRQPGCVIGYLAEDGTRVIMDAIEGKNITLKKFLNERLKPILYNYYDGVRFVGVGDPTGPATWKSDETPFDYVTEFFQKDMGQRDFMIFKGSNDVVRRLETVDEQLAIRNRVVLNGDGRCQALEDALLGEYHWVMSKDGDEQRSTWKGKGSHVADAHHYFHVHLDELLSDSEDMFEAEYLHTPRHKGFYG